MLDLTSYHMSYGNHPILAPLIAETQRLQDAILTHRAQKADDRCIEDDDRLYAALQDGISCDRAVGSKEEMLRNCQRFIENRCVVGTWVSYAALEEQNRRLQEQISELRQQQAAK